MMKTFEDTVIEGVESLRGQQAELVRNLDSLDKSVKNSFEELTRLKNQQADHAQLLASLKRTLAALERERSSVFKSREDAILNRITGNEEKREIMLGLLKKIAFPHAKLPEHVERALTGSDSGVGAATIPTAVAEDIYHLLAEYGVWAGFGVIRVPSRTVSIPVATARPAAYWIGAGSGAAEGTAITAGDFSGASLTLSLQTIGSLLHVSRELIQDAGVDVVSFVLRQIAQSVAGGLDWACISAAGATNQTDGGYTGIFEAAALNTNLKATAATGRVTVAQTKVDDWAKCLSTVSPAVLRRGGQWWMNPAILAKAMTVQDTTGRPIFISAIEAPSFGAIGRILGYPVVLSDAAPTTDAVNAKVAVFGDPQGLAVGVAQDMELEQTTALKFAENQVSIRATMRAGTRIKTTTGSTTLKPFAVLTLPAS
ncbi:MAG: phage major capsid protein [Verrucomicrobiae bacterium]|nr:phage major capsid protein [Verrucomicrobiae bacterium]